jgi:4'-phosphopantetheinyl transferase
VDVWWARRADADSSLAALLDDAERGRLAAYHRVEDRDRFLVGCTLAKTAIASYEGGPARRPAAVALDRTCTNCGKPHGKPRVKDSDLELSVSHSGDRIAVAVARATPVGVDVEWTAGRQRDRPDDEQAGLERYVLSEAEQAALTAGTRRRDFLVAWTRKEAVTKATGDGLRVPFKDVVVSPAQSPPAVIAWPYPDPPDTVALFDLDAGDGYVAALAVIGRCDAVRPRDGSALLAKAMSL